MIVLDVEQGSPEWLAARLGIPTASQFSRILTPKTRKPAGAQDKYIHELCAEWLLGHPIDDGKSVFMERGSAMEREALAWYELQRDVTVQRVGFALRDDRQVGCSPDGLVGEEGGLEMKVPKADVHVGHLLGESGDEKHICQVQGGIWICGRRWWDFLSYNPAIEPALSRSARDDGFIEALEREVNAFIGRLTDAKEQLLKLGHEPRTPELGRSVSDDPQALKWEIEEAISTEALMPEQYRTQFSEEYAAILKIEEDTGLLDAVRLKTLATMVSAVQAQQTAAK